MVSPMWTIEIDRPACLGTGLCAGTAPQHFELAEDGRVRPRHTEIEPDEAVGHAAEMCPVEAIRVRDAATGEVLAPL